MNITEISIKRPSLIIVLFSIFTLLGFIGYKNLSYELMPDFNQPVVVIKTVYPGAEPNEVETSVSRKIEDALSNLEGVDYLVTKSLPNASIIIANLKYGTDLDKSMQDAQRYIDNIRKDLPQDILSPVMSKVSPNDLPIMSISATSNLSATEFYQKMKDDYLPQIQKIKGVAEITILGGEEREIKGEALSAAETIRIITGQENQWFAQYAAEHPKREQVLGAWAYLDKTYTIDSLFAGQKTPKKAIQAEKQRIHAEDVAFINKLPKDSYVSWFLPTRKLLSSVSAVAQHRPEEIPATLKALRSIDYSDSRLYKSGLLSDAIDSHVWFIENSMSPLDSVHALLIRSIDIILSQLKMDERKYNDITDYLFGLLEQRSMFPVAEYLSLKVLEDRSCTVDIKLANKLEGYRKLKIGNKAPDITFGAHSYFPEHIQAGSLSAIDAAYKVVVFAANWCNHCQEVMPKLAHHYTKWRAKGIEVVLVSLDENMGEFTTFAAPLPFTATCDYKKWESQPVKDYHIFGTPSFYLLKNNLEIVLKPSTVEQIDAWIDWHVK